MEEENNLFRKLSGIEDVLGTTVFFDEIKEGLLKYLVKELELFRKIRLDDKNREAKMVGLYRLYEYILTIDTPEKLNSFLHIVESLHNFHSEVDWLWRRCWRKIDRIKRELNFDGYREHFIPMNKNAPIRIIV